MESEAGVRDWEYCMYVGGDRSHRREETNQGSLQSDKGRHKRCPQGAPGFKICVERESTKKGTERSIRGSENTG